MKTNYGKSATAMAVISALGLSACNVEITEDMLSQFDSSKIGVVTNKDANSIEVNGVTYDTSKAQVYLDGLSSDISEIKEGMVVSVSGSSSSSGNGTAELIHFEDEIEGKVISNSVSQDNTGSLNVMGQNVKVDDNTVFESYDVTDSGVSDIDDGNIVEVSGFASGDGEIWATRIEVKNEQYYQGSEMELKGNISNLTASTFNIGNLSVNYENAALDYDFMGTLQNGQYVEVKSYQGFTTDGAFIADEVELKGNGYKEIEYDNDDDNVEIKGVVTNVISPSEFEVDGYHVVLNNQSRVSASFANALHKGLIVEVEGDVDRDGRLIAREVEIESESFNDRDDSSSSGYDDRDDDRYDDNNYDDDYDDDDRDDDDDSDSDRS